MVQFTVYTEPVAQGRPKFTTIGGFARAYDPKKSKDYKSFVKMVAMESKPDRLLEGPLVLSLDVYRSIPKSFSKKKTQEAIQGKLRPTTKPDVDNFLKGIKDALKSVIWVDDSQVVEVQVRKWYSDTPRIEVKCLQLEEVVNA